MGSLASYKASVCAVYKRSIKTKEKNSKESIEEFLKNKPNFGKTGVELDIEEATFENIKNGKYLAYSFIDEYGDLCTTDKDIDEQYFEESEEWEDITAIVKIEASELEYLNLDILKSYDYYDPNGNYYREVNLGNLYESIYCDNDNSSSQVIKIPKDILEDLYTGKCTLRLEGDGSGDHC